ncbi:MAG: protease pro-enzyme activation domain-containing protein, partial [Verrucomicrobiota bacterium]|nr:protease pro-enzyme activation domain-containing protein [Verrucomicrobiota bacterium]
MNKFLSLFLSMALTTLAQAQSGNAILRGSAPPWAHSKNYKGAADPNIGIGFRVYLGWNNSTAAEALARAVSNPRSSSYRQFLTAAQFRQQFAPSQAQVAAVQSWLRNQGFKINYTPMNNHYVSAEGTVANAQTAFGTKFAMYKVNGKTVRSPSNDVSIPASLANIVSGVAGLDESAVFVHTNRVADTNAPPEPGFRNSPPLSLFWAQKVSPYAYPSGFTDLNNPATAPWAIRGHTPSQIKGAYGISGYDGAGQTVAIIDAYASPTILQDVNQWSTNRGLPTMTASQLVQIVPPGIY